MGHYPFTLFNGITAVLLIATAVVIWRTWRSAAGPRWRIAYYAAAAAHGLIFKGGLNECCIAAGAVCAFAVAFGRVPMRLRFAELIPLAYIAYRCVGLIMMW